MTLHSLVAAAALLLLSAAPARADPAFPPSTPQQQAASHHAKAKWGDLHPVAAAAAAVPAAVKEPAAQAAPASADAKTSRWGSLHVNAPIPAQAVTSPDAAAAAPHWSDFAAKGAVVSSKYTNINYAHDGVIPAIPASAPSGIHAAPAAFDGFGRSADRYQLMAAATGPNQKSAHLLKAAYYAEPYSAANEDPVRALGHTVMNKGVRPYASPVVHNVAPLAFAAPPLVSKANAFGQGVQQKSAEGEPSNGAFVGIGLVSGVAASAMALGGYILYKRKRNERLIPIEHHSDLPTHGEHKQIWVTAHSKKNNTDAAGSLQVAQVQPPPATVAAAPAPTPAAAVASSGSPANGSPMGSPSIPPATVDGAKPQRIFVTKKK